MVIGHGRFLPGGPIQIAVFTVGRSGGDLDSASAVRKLPPFRSRRSRSRFSKFRSFNPQIRCGLFGPIRS